MPKIHYGSSLLVFFPKHIYGFTFGQHIFFRDRASLVTRRMINHEKVHAEQYKKHGIIGFLWIYIFKEWKVPYRQKTFEKEAYAKESLSPAPIIKINRAGDDE